MLANLVDIFYYNSNLGFAVSSLNYAIIKTTNGGVTWELPAGTSVTMNWIQKSPSGSGIGNNLCLHPNDRNSYFVVYGNKVYVSRDKGDNWNQIATISVGTRAHSFYVSPPDENSCYKYLAELKWSAGYTCSKCGNSKFCKGHTEYDKQCTKCAYIETPTAGDLIPFGEIFNS